MIYLLPAVVANSNRPSGGINSELLFHTKAGSDAEWTTPEVAATGAAPTKVGTPTYTTGEFGNGTNGVANAAFLMNPINFWPNNEEGAVGLFIKPSVLPIVNTNLMVLFRPGNTNDAEIQIRFLSGGDSFNISFSKTGVTDFFNSSVTASTFFSTSSFTHIGFSWNINGVGGGSNTFEVYIDNVLRMSGTTAIESLDWRASDTESHAMNAAPGQHANQWTRGVVDNLKIYQQSIQDWSADIAGE